MTLRVLLLMVLAALVALPAAATQDDEPQVELELRAVSEAAPGRILVDRGTRDGLVVGDLVTFLPRGSSTLRGSVRELRDRTAVVNLFDKTASVPPGTKGLVRLPPERVAPVVTPPVVAAQVDPVEPQAGAGAPEKAGSWENADEEWKSGMPLLAEVGVQRPEERATSVSGRIYSSGDQMFSNDGGRSSGFYRLGSTLAIENSLGRGETLNADVELIYQNARSPDRENDDGTHLRIDQLSYSEGDTRFSDHAWEVGRFLQRGMPEFGFLDGVQWRERLPGGDTWGTSAGFLPEPSEDQKTGQDFQVAGYYRWIADSTEQLSATAGYQKTLHNSSSDRDLVVTRVDWLPEHGWNFLGTAWIDFYNGADAFEDGPLELSLARLSTSRTWDNSAHVDLTLSHQAHVDLKRFELQPVVNPVLEADDRYTRLALRGERPLGESVRAHGGIAGWVDQDDVGGDVDTGLEWQDVFVERDRFDTTVFANSGKFSDVAGTRLTWGRFGQRAGWDLFYEVSFHRVLGFSAERDDFLQHWMGARGNLTDVRGWILSLQAETRAWDDFNSWSLGFYTQKSL